LSKDMDSIHELEEKIRRVTASGQRLRSLGMAARCACWEQVLLRLEQRLLHSESELQRLAQAVQLSPEMVAWSLRTSLEGFSPTDFALWAGRWVPDPDDAVLVPAGLVAVVLAGNVFTAGLRAIAYPWLVGSPVLVKLPSAAVSLVPWVQEALAAADPLLADTLESCVFPRTEEAYRAMLLDQADVVSVFGDDQTVENVKKSCPVGTRIQAHGHGISMAYLSAHAVQRAGERGVKQWLADLACDVAAYEQRGCLSPLALWVEQPGPLSSEWLAEELAKAMEQLEKRWPRTPGSAEQQSAEMQWKGVAQAVGQTWMGPWGMISLERESSFRANPGGRLLQLLEIDDISSFIQRTSVWGNHLKCVGIAGSVEEWRPKLGAWSARVFPRMVSWGQMQRPGWMTWQDGCSPWEGLVRYVSMPPELR
jgi:hypothetical protein